MRFEEMRERIYLQELEQVKDATSGELVSQVKASSGMWAQIRAASPKGEHSALGGEALLNVRSFVVRYRDGVDSRTHRIKTSDGKLWDIIDLPKTIGKKEGMEIIAQWSGVTV